LKFSTGTLQVTMNFMSCLLRRLLARYGSLARPPWEIYLVHLDLHHSVGADPRVRPFMRADTWVGPYEGFISRRTWYYSNVRPPVCKVCPPTSINHP
jgi:hypothetical protein